MPHLSRARLALFLAIAGTSGSALAAAPLGWIHGDFISAYTQKARSVEITASKLKVNDTIDFLDIRDDLIAGNRRLVDNSGDLDGWQGTVRVGLLDTLELFYLRQEHDLSLKLGPLSSIDVLDMDEALSTTLSEVGLKWTFYQADFNAPNGEVTSATLELAWLDNESDDFVIGFDGLSYRSGNLDASIRFDERQTARVEKLRDDGWRARLIYSTALAPNWVGSAWLGYSRHQASSGTGTSVPLNFLAEPLTQRFDLDEDHLLLGASLHWQITPRLPLQLSYEFIKLRNQDIDISQNPNPNLPLPGFLTSGNLSQDDTNHVLSANLSWWLTPRFHLGLSGKLFSNQLLGVAPHYNNPLSASFSDTPYGYLGLRLGLDL